MTYPPIDIVRIGFVGLGSRGIELLRILLSLDGVKINALCADIAEGVVRAQDLVIATGQPKPAGYAGGETDFKRLNLPL